MVLETKHVRIATDPGVYTIPSANFANLTALIISHGHQDHLSMDLLKSIMEQNPSLRIITNTDVANTLQDEGISAEVVMKGQSTKVGEVEIRGFGSDHALIHNSHSTGSNVAYMIDDLFFTGDSFELPDRSVRYLTLPVAGPWLQLGDAIDYALKVRPQVCIPVHDGNLTSWGAVYTLPEKTIGEAGIKFVPLENGVPTDI